jgi:hypothetical protein
LLAGALEDANSAERRTAPNAERCLHAAAATASCHRRVGFPRCDTTRTRQGEDGRPRTRAATNWSHIFESRHIHLHPCATAIRRELL